jgi:glyoxylase-like metal-dependent hydrolase (beta-lactamase superfamily II)
VQVGPGVWRIGERLGERWLYLYLVEGRRPLLVDTGLAPTPEATLFPALARLRIPPERLGTVLLTHPDVDHFGGNAAVRRAAPGAALVGHAADRAWLESRERILAERYGWYAAHDLAYPPATLAWMRDNLGPDTPLSRTVAGGDWLDLGDRRLQVLHLPGHSPGHLGVWEPESRTAIIGDAVMGEGLSDATGRRIQPPPYFAVAPYLEAAARLAALAPRRLLAAHYPAMDEAAATRFLAASRAFVGEVQQAVVEVLRTAGGGAVTLKAGTAAVDARVGPFPVLGNELAGPVRAHLEDLVGAGRAEPTESGGRPAWRWRGGAA